MPGARPGRRAGGGAAGGRRPGHRERRWPRRSATGRPGCGSCWSTWPPATRRRPRASSCASSAAAGGSTPATGSPRWSSGSCWTARRAGCPGPRWRPWRSSPTGSRSPGPGSPAVRGVNVDGVIRTLMSRGLIEDVGTDPDTGGLLYRTTDLFLERLGLSICRSCRRSARCCPTSTGSTMSDPENPPRKPREGERATTSGRRPAAGRAPPTRRGRTARTASGCRRCWPRPASRPAARPRS